MKKVSLMVHHVAQEAHYSKHEKYEFITIIKYMQNFMSLLVHRVAH